MHVFKTEVVKKICFYVGIFILLNILIALSLGDISFPSFDFSIKGIKSFLEYNYYINTLVYVIVNVIVIIFFVVLERFSDESLNPFLFLFVGAFVFIALYFLNSSIFMDKDEINQSKYKVYNFMVENEIENDRICNVNIKEIAFSNLNREYGTPVLCKDKTIAYLLKDGFFIKGLKKFTEGVYDNDISNLYLLSKCEYYCKKDETHIYNNKKTISFISENANQEDWDKFNKDLFNEFKDLKIIKKTSTILTSKGDILDTRQAVYFVTPKTLKEFYIMDINSYSEIINLRGYYYLAMRKNDKIILPIKQEDIDKYFPNKK